MHKLLIGISLLFVSLTAAAERWSVVGAGAFSCGEALEKVGDPLREAVMWSWGQGYMSGLNGVIAAADEEAVDLPHYKAIVPFIKKYCEDDPLAYVVDAIDELFLELRERQNASDEVIEDE